MFRAFGKSAQEDESDLTESPVAEADQSRNRSFSESAAVFHHAKARFSFKPGAARNTLDSRNMPPAGTDGLPLSPQSSADQEKHGLTVIHDPPDRSGDIIFVHGLGGSSRRSWSHERDPAHFWPIWLSREPELREWRIWTYGYNSSFSFSGSDTALNISDFAKDLLSWIQTFRPEGNQPTVLGTLPICFVAHSMGGLVVKKAYYLGKQDEKYRALIEHVHSIIFLGTPHRGVKYASMLNNILAAAPLPVNKKVFIQEIENNSASLQDVNDQFGRVCEGLELYSFWETRKTTVAPGVTKLIVDKDSAMLGFPQETSLSLDADHYTISKFKSPDHPNYIHVKNVMTQILPTRLSAHRSPVPRHVVPAATLLDVLGIRESSNVDLELHKARAMAGTCQWILKRPSFAQWIQPENQELRTFWLTGLPATGKSTMASFVISYLQEHFDHASCQFHFFSHDSPEKRTVGYCLRSLVYQLAQSDDIFRQKLEEYHNQTGISFEEHKTLFIWKNLYMDFLFTLKLSRPLFWVIDALDECESPFTLVNFVNEVPDWFPIKVILFSRPNQALQAHMSARFVVEEISVRDTFHDIRSFVEDELMHTVPNDSSVSKEVADQILSKANGSFLWVRLTLDTLRDNWHTKGDIRKALNSMPAGMESLYKKLMARISDHGERNRYLALRIITWAACSYRPLRVNELEEALKPEFGDFSRLEDSITHLCGHFVKIERSRLLLIHETASEFLFKGGLASSLIGTGREANERIALACLNYLSNDGWRTTLGKLHASVNDAAFKKKCNGLTNFDDQHPFLNYAVRFWAYHTSCSPPNSQELLSKLSVFLRKYALQWMHAVALSQDLRVFTKTAQYLKAYSKKCQRAGLPDPPTTFSPIDTQFLSLWSGDLIHLVGKFGDNMRRNPISLYHEIPTFCPAESQVGKNYASHSPQTLSVKGLSDNGWDDCVSRINVGDGRTIERVACTARYILTLVSGTCQLMVWDADTSELVGIADHQSEWFIMMAINARKTHVVTATGKAYRVWEIATQTEVSYLPRYYEARPLAIRFLPDSDYHKLIVGYDDYTVWCGSSHADSEKWDMHDLRYDDDEGYNEEDHDSPRIMAFSPDCSQVAVAVGGRPIEVWDLNVKGKQTPRQYIRTEDRFKGQDDVWNYAEAIRWTPEGDMLLILYQDTKLVSWKLFDGEDVEFPDFGAREMVISDNGLVLLTSDSSGSLSVWSLPRIQLMFRLHYPSLVRDLSISPIGHRLFDARDSFCHVWEPEFLVRSDELELEDHSSTIGSTVGSEPILTHAYSSIQSQVFSVACDTQGDYFCCGNDDGRVTINEMENGNKVRTVYRHADSMTIITLEWSKSLRYMVSGDDSGRIVTKRLQSKGKNKWSVFGCLDFRVQSSVKQLLFSPAEDFLLCVSEKRARVWDLRRKKLVNVQRFPSSGGRWINHPSDKALLVWLDATRLLVRKWAPDPNDLVVGGDPETPLLPPPAFEQLAQGSPERGNAQEVTWLAQPLTAPCLVYQQKSTGGGAARSLRPARSGLAAVEIGDLPREPGVHAVRRRALPVSAHVARVVGLFQDALVYLDDQPCLGSWQLGTPPNARRTHFFLPKDWLSQVNQQPVLLNEQGTLLLARNGDVAIIRNGIVATNGDVASTRNGVV